MHSGTTMKKRRLGGVLGLALVLAVAAPAAVDVPDAYADANYAGNEFRVENRWGGGSAPWHPGGTWIIGGRAGVVAVHATSADNGKTFTGTMTYGGEGAIGFRANLLQNNQYKVENQWGGSSAPWHAGGTWTIGGRSNQPVVALSITSPDAGKTLSGTMTYKGEGPIDFRASVVALAPPKPPPPPPPVVEPPPPFFMARKALKFSGSASARTDSVVTSATDNVALECWVKADRNTGTQIILYNGNTGSSGYGLYLQNTKIGILNGGVTYVTSNAVLDVGKWHHLAATREGGTWKLYVDGAATSVANASAAPNAPNGATAVGSNNGGGENFAGTIDEARVWNVARTAMQINDNAKMNLPATTAGLVAYWRLDDGSGTEARNAISSGKSLKLTGAPVPSWVDSEAGVAQLALEPGADDIVEDVPDMSAEDIQAVMNYIKVKTTGVRLPFCWRQTKTRGAGTIPGRVADCPATYTNNGATCGRSADTIGAPSHLADCPSGYTNMGLTCYASPSTYWKGCTTIFHKYDCNPGYTDNGCTCGRGGGSVGMGSMTCGSGYHRSDITARCIKDCPSGYTNTGETCFRGVSTLGMDAMTCNAGEVKHGARCYPANGTCGAGQEDDAGLCYSKCPAGFSGVGPVCWQQCDSGWSNCALGCAKSSTDCGMVVADQVLAPLILAANIATLGLDTPATAGATDTLKIGSKTVTSSTKTGKALITAIKKLQSVKPEGLAKGASVWRRVYHAKAGTNLRKLKTSMILADKVGYQMTGDYSRIYASDFAAQTSADINAAIDRAFHPKTAAFLKETWAKMQLAELASTNGWVIAQDTMAIISIVDITGVTGVVSAYAHPTCQDLTPMPCISANLTHPNCK